MSASIVADCGARERALAWDFWRDTKRNDKPDAREHLRGELAHDSHLQCCEVERSGKESDEPWKLDIRGVVKAEECTRTS